MSTDLEQVRPFQLGHRPQLDGLRGVAIFCVLLHHAGIAQIHGGHIGVDIFFVLSGFLITVLLYQEYLQFETINLKRFYIRRFLRLMPALVGLLVLFAAFTLATKSAAGLAKAEQAIFITGLYLSDFAIAFSYADMGALSHTWSLAIEERFYLLYPISLIFLLGKRRRPRTAFVILCLLVVIIAVNRMLLWGTEHQDVMRVYYGFDTRADGLLVGCLLGLLVATGRLPIIRPVLAFAAAGVLAFALVFADWDSRLYHFGLPLINLASAIVVAYVLTSPVGWLGNRWVVKLGVISYGLYLWHHPIFIIVRERVIESPWGVLIIGSAIGIACAALSYYLIERPCLKLKERFAPSQPKADAFPVDILNAPAR